MLINIILVVLVFGAGRKKLNRYALAAIYGGIKGVIAMVLTGNLVVALSSLVVWTPPAFALLVLIDRLDYKEAGENTISDYSLKRKSAFKWEYIALAAVVIFLILGDFLASLFVPAGS